LKHRFRKEKPADRGVEIHPHVLEFLEVESARSMAYETGGVIAGEGDIAVGPVLISKASGPGPRATRSGFSFSRDTKHCQQQLDGWAKNSNGKVDYLGEWHKHHESLPRPSSTDVLTCRQIAGDPNYHVSQCLLLIMGKSNHRNSLRAFVILPSGKVEVVEWKEAKIGMETGDNSKSRS
jgi:integrative and conjugative element protein (TIGR02256 family)